MGNHLPKHIAIIMDGNGRWAGKRGLPRLMGHRAGAKTVDVITEACAEIGIKALTLYSFSTENWVRPKSEVTGLMRLLEEYLQAKLEKLLKNDIRLNTIGAVNELPDYVRRNLERAIEATKNNRRMVLTLALNYGARQEILNAALKLADELKSGRVSIAGVNQDDFSNLLETRALPEVDFLIRTSGEYRLSNFLLWQISYAEIYVTKVLWPDFRRKDLLRALAEYEHRSRRFGGVKACS